VVSVFTAFVRNVYRVTVSGVCGYVGERVSDAEVIQRYSTVIEAIQH
jgi:hypothetical protein